MRNRRLPGDDSGTPGADDGSVDSAPTGGVNMRVGRPTIASAVVVLGLSVTVAACGGGNDNGSASSSSSSSGGAKKIALLLPENQTARYETQDRPHFTNT